MFLVGTFYTKRKIMYNGYQTLVMHNPFFRYSEANIIHNCQLFIMSVTPLQSIMDLIVFLRREWLGLGSGDAN